MNPNPTELELEKKRRRVARQSLVQILAWSVFSAASIFSERLQRAGDSWGWAALLSVAGAAVLGFAIWRGERDLMRSEDELEQRIRTEALANALPYTVALACLFARFNELGIRYIPSYILWAWLLFPYTVTTFVARRRFR